MIKMIMTNVLDMREFYTAYENFSRSIPPKFRLMKNNLKNFINPIQDAALLDMVLSREIKMPRCFMAFDSKYSVNLGFVRPIDILSRLNWVILNQEYFGLETAGDIKSFESFVKVMKMFAKTLRIEIIQKLKIMAKNKELKPEQAAKEEIKLTL